MVDNEQLKEIIGRIKYEKKLNQEEVAELLGVKNPYLSGMTNGKYPVTENVLRKISEIFGIDTGNDFISPKNKESTKTQNQNMIPLLNDVVTIGGSDIVAEPDSQHHSVDYIDKGDWFPDATAAIVHYGNSMIEYPSGCILAVKKMNDISLIVPGKDYVIETREYRVTKKFQTCQDEAYFMAYSTNHEKHPDGKLIHEPFRVPWDAVLSLYLVLGYIVKINGETTIYRNKNT